ncbi:hypothetical protein NKR23_g9389 [Pleurostoma richardsiae]|uniref:Uncharacterized protein n=1 Tax=Pleurostoma richardsiae TaxID=41990 RepID=A0AA38R6Z7_9PEZI|nr:hypothetical protein NKR23_g9389 [Pleurostoma richardsiae]
MDGLKELARSTFESVQNFKKLENDHRYNVLEVGSFPDGHMSFNEWLVYEDDLASFMTKGPLDGDNNSTADASLKLICIQRDLDVTLGVSKTAFMRIISAMNADPCVLYMISRDYDGYHEFNGAESPVTVFMGLPRYAVVWVFDRRRMTTRGLLIERRSGSWPGLRDVLRTYRRYIFTPHLLSFVSCLHTLHFFDRQTNDTELQAIRRIEDATGFGRCAESVASTEIAMRVEAGELTRWALIVGEVQSSAANKLRHLKTARGLLSLIQLEHQTKVADVVAPEFLHRYHRSMEALNEAIPAIERQMGTYEEYLVYLKDRAKCVSAVVLALLTRGAAERNTRLTPPHWLTKKLGPREPE